LACSLVQAWQTVIVGDPELPGEKDGRHIVISERLLAGLRLAVEAAPDDVAIRLHLAQLLHSAGHRDEAVRQAAAVLQREPANLEAIRLISDGGKPTGPEERDSVVDPVDPAEPDASRPADPDGDVLSRLDAELADIVPPQYADAPDAAGVDGFDVERVGLRLSDVGGMAEVKARLEASLLAPLRNPELAR
jgi:hypothetical protein